MRFRTRGGGIGSHGGGMIAFLWFNRMASLAALPLIWLNLIDVTRASYAALDCVVLVGNMISFAWWWSEARDVEAR